MLKTIMIGGTISVQGNYVKTLPNGTVQVRDGDKLFVGRPVEPRRAA